MSLSSAVENMKTKIQNKEESDDEEIDINFMNNLIKEYRLRKDRIDLDDLQDEGIDIPEDEFKSKKKGTHMNAEDISKQVNQTGF